MATAYTPAPVISNTFSIPYTGYLEFNSALENVGFNSYLGLDDGSGLIVNVYDADGDIDTSFTGNVTITISTNPNAGVLNGTATVSAVSGVATFSNLTITGSGTGYKVTATAASKTSAVSGVFNVGVYSVTTANVGGSDTPGFGPGIGSYAPTKLKNYDFLYLLWNDPITSSQLVLITNADVTTQNMFSSITGGDATLTSAAATYFANIPTSSEWRWSGTQIFNNSGGSYTLTIS